MADFLGSILKSMEKPPSTVRSDQKAVEKKQEQAMRKMVEDEKRQLKDFKAKVEKHVNEFNADESRSSLKLEPMDKVHRTIVHDVIDAAGLVAFSFGSEPERYLVIYKQDSVPSEEELTALRRGQVYDPEKAAMMKVLEAKEEIDAKKKKKIVPVSNYRTKYEHLIGKDTGKKAATISKPSEQFGLVPTALKRDQRSIEEALNDIRKKKLQKVTDASTSDGNHMKNESNSIDTLDQEESEDEHSDTN